MDIPSYIVINNPFLHSIMEHSKDFRRDVKMADKEVVSLGRHTCRHCQNSPEERQCERFIKVTSRDTEGLEGKLAYSFDDTDQIPLEFKVG